MFQEVEANSFYVVFNEAANSTHTLMLHSIFGLITVKAFKVRNVSNLVSTLLP